MMTTKTPTSKTAFTQSAVSSQAKHTPKNDETFFVHVTEQIILDDFITPPCFINNTDQVDEIKDFLHNKPEIQDFNSFFITFENGEYHEIYGSFLPLPMHYSALHKLEWGHKPEPGPGLKETEAFHFFENETVIVQEHVCATELYNEWKQLMKTIVKNKLNNLWTSGDSRYEDQILKDNRFFQACSAKFATCLFNEFMVDLETTIENSQLRLQAHQSIFETFLRIAVSNIEFKDFGRLIYQEIYGRVE